jgi:ABC-type dipeptide/oligopeptide/nickel transport system permease component
MCDNEYFPVLKICRSDVADVFGKVALNLTDEQMELLAKKMGNNDMLMETYWQLVEVWGSELFGLKIKTREEIRKEQEEN